MFTLPHDVRLVIYHKARQLAIRDKLERHLTERSIVQKDADDIDYYVTLTINPQKTIELYKSCESVDSEYHIVHDYTHVVYEHDLSHIKVDILVSKVLAVCFSCASKHYFLSSHGTKKYTVSHHDLACASGALYEDYHR